MATSNVEKFKLFIEELEPESGSFSTAGDERLHNLKSAAEALPGLATVLEEPAQEFCNKMNSWKIKPSEAEVTLALSLEAGWTWVVKATGQGSVQVTLKWTTREPD